MLQHQQNTMFSPNIRTLATYNYHMLILHKHISLITTLTSHIYTIIMPPHYTQSLPLLYTLWTPYTINPFTQPPSITLHYIRPHYNTHQTFESSPCTHPPTTHIFTHAYSTHPTIIHHNHKTSQNMKLTNIRTPNLHTPYMNTHTIYLIHMSPKLITSKIFTQTYYPP